MKKGHEIATIDVALVTVKPNATGDTEQDAGITEIALDTANSIQVTVNSETTDAIKLIIKGKLKAQKGEETTITGNNIVFTDNVFNPELVLILQGGTIDTDTDGKFKKYTPPAAGEVSKQKPFELNVYSAIYGADALIKGYEKITYPNCLGQPIAFSSEDGTFRAQEYTINSAPDVGEPPYVLEIVKDLPVIDADQAVAQTLSLD